MKAVANKKSKIRQVNIVIDSTIDEKYGNKALFPEKVTRAKAFLEKHGLPESWGTFEPAKEK